MTQLPPDQRLSCKNSLTQDLEYFVNRSIVFEFPFDRFLFSSYPNTKLGIPIRPSRAFLREFVNASIRNGDKILLPACDAHAIDDNDAVGSEDDLISDPLIRTQDFFSPD